MATVKKPNSGIRLSPVTLGVLKELREAYEIFVEDCKAEGIGPTTMPSDDVMISMALRTELKDIRKLNKKRKKGACHQPK